MAALSTAGYGLEREASTLGQRANELDERRQHIDTDVLPHAFGLSFELGQLSPYECCPCGDAQGIKYAWHEHVFQTL